MSNWSSWCLALRPWSFAMTAITVLIGTLWAAGEGISWPLFGLALLSMVILHGATNLLNDYCDVKNRVDTPETPTARYRPHPLAHRELALRQVLALSLTLYGVGIALGLLLVLSRGPMLLAIGLAGAAAGLGYTAGPLPLKYRGLGEPAVFLVWGPLGVLGAYYVQTGALSLPLALVSLPFGLLVALVLLANNLRDVTYDRKQQLRTVPVRLGESAARLIYVSMVGLAFLAVVVMSVAGPLSPWSLLVLLALPIAVPLCVMVYREVPPDADARTARLDTAFGVLLALSLLIERLLA